jgi:hypothetical protein
VLEAVAIHPAAECPGDSTKAGKRGGGCIGEDGVEDVGVGGVVEDRHGSDKVLGECWESVGRVLGECWESVKKQVRKVPRF